MKSAELKTYLTILTQKVKGSAYKEVEITGKEIKVRGEKGNDNILFVLECGTNGNGIYSPEALNILAMDIEANIEAYRIRDAENWQVADLTCYNHPYQLNKDMITDLTEAVKFVSNDDYRPALCRVHFMNGDLVATDGYRAYLKRVDINANCNLSPSTVAILKKCHKYGDWFVSFGTTPFSDNTQIVNNKYFFVYDKGVDTTVVFPDMRTLLEERNLNTDTVVELPYKALKSANIGEVVNLFEGGEITLDEQSVPVKATITKETTEYVKGQDIRLIMPRDEASGFIAFSLPLLKCITPDKNGNIKLAICADKNAILVV